MHLVDGVHGESGELVPVYVGEASRPDTDTVLRPKAPVQALIQKQHPVILTHVMMEVCFIALFMMFNIGCLYSLHVP